MKIEPAPAPTRFSYDKLYVSADGTVIYWQSYTSLLGLTVSYTGYTTLDAETYETLGRGTLGPQIVRSLSIDARPACIFDTPGTVPGSVEGGIVEVPVVPRPSCGQWRLPADGGVLNPGPHTGPALLRVFVQPNIESQVRYNTIVMGGLYASIPQPAEPPSAPEMTATVHGTRLSVSWTPTPGAGIVYFFVRGAARGSEPTPVGILWPNERTWTSPPLSPGSYVVDVIARNHAGDSPASNRFEFSIGSHEAPRAPTDLVASVHDDVVTLTWAPPPGDPAPSGYIVEAAPIASTAFAGVARTEMPTFSATRLPAGSWQARVRAVTPGGSSTPSAAVSVNATPCVSPPGVPTDLWVVPTTGFVAPATVTLRWAAPTTGSVEAYIVDAGTAPGLANLGSFTVPSSRLFAEAPVPLTSRVFLHVRARNACGVSPASAGTAVVVLNTP